MAGLIVSAREADCRGEQVNTPVFFIHAANDCTTIFEVLDAELADDLPLSPGDSVQLQQVLLNLVMNGLEAMSAINERVLELTVKTDRAENKEVVVAVTDRGAGIKPQELDRVFKAFHTTKSASTAMGLAISRSIIEAHGGRLSAESNIGPRTTFKFTLPAGVRGS